MKVTFDINCTDEFGRHQSVAVHKDPTIVMIAQTLSMRLDRTTNEKEKQEQYIAEAINDAFELGKSVGGREVLLSLKEEIK